MKGHPVLSRVARRKPETATPSGVAVRNNGCSRRLGPSDWTKSGLEAVLELFELSAQLVRQPLADEREVILDEGELTLPGRVVH